MEVVVHGRNVEVPDHFRLHVTEKLGKVERYDQKIIRADVELHHERNRRQNGSCQHIEITCRTRGPVVRSEACAEDFYKALDVASDKLERRFRQAADRRRVHHGRRTPTSLAAATADALTSVETTVDVIDDAGEDEGPGHIVREKDHPPNPMTDDQPMY